MKKVIIIGGGIAGLTAGIYLQKAGFTTEIYERNAIPGGLCIGWKRENCFIDNCIHWLTGTKQGSDINKLWYEIGALGDGVELYEPDSWFSSELGGQVLTLWRDSERTRRDMLELSPEDAVEINKFIDSLALVGDMPVPADKPIDVMKMSELMKLGKSMAGCMKVMKEYGKENLADLSKRFHHPLIRQTITDYMAYYYQAFGFVYCYATIVSGNGDIPKGGSLAMSLRIADKFKKLGGTIHFNCNVEKVVLNKKLATGIRLADGKEIKADYVICACDTDVTFHKLLPENYMPRKLKQQYENTEMYRINSGFQIAYLVDGVYPELTGSKIFPCEEMEVGATKANRMSIRSYGYEPDFAPEGKTVLQTNFIQFEDDYNFWNQCRSDTDAYIAQKMEIANMAKERIEVEFPFLKGKIHVVDVWTPATYNRYCGCYKGAYMSFANTKKAKMITLPNTIKGLNNVYLASQWQYGPGGLPLAATNGKFAAWRIINEKKGMKCMA